VLGGSCLIQSAGKEPFGLKTKHGFGEMIWFIIFPVMWTDIAISTFI